MFLAISSYFVNMKKSRYVFTDGINLVLNEKQSRATGNRIIVNTDSEKLPVFIERKLVLENMGRLFEN